MIAKVLNVLCSLIVVPLTLSCLTQEEYGVWLTLSSVLLWFSFFDVGLGNGLRNYLTQALSMGDWKLGRKYLSTTLVIMSGIVLFFLFITFLAYWMVDFSRLFNTRSIPPQELSMIFLVASVFTLNMFLVKNVGVIFMSMQRYAVNDLLLLLGNLLSLLCIWWFVRLNYSSLLAVVLVFTSVPVLVFLIAGAFLFFYYPQLLPSFKAVDYSLTRMLVGKGLSFFLIQITSCLVVFASANVFIAQYSGPSDVTVYNLAYKYFNVLAIGYTIFISPLWNAYTDAYVKGDMLWIRRSFIRSLMILGLFVALGAVMLIVAPWFYHFWVQGRVEVPSMVSLSVLLFILSFNFNNAVTYLLNGLNIIWVQTITSVLATMIYLLMVALLGEHGIVGVSLSMVVCYLLMGGIHLYQCNMILRGKATGIWLK